eukprot:CAMPEP_0116119400 /NCGR_PEP_ID=MMETSP0329-20121206/2617_1 /TAXON_ID=697910 /ORGANISM="Pseudo-nitzschia arenysensis, Strain B593" /LENGTH=628 /DNA_ID=CAMNT_0003613091 /DNA_START=76 /DNA_END=1962 /DNA_ORIENTATION=-
MERQLYSFPTNGDTEFVVDQLDYAVLEAMLVYNWGYHQPGGDLWRTISSMIEVRDNRIWKLRCPTHIRSIPPSIGQMDAIEELDLSGTELLTSLPVEVGSLGNLITLKLCKSGIASMPLSICSLESLQLLDLSCTKNLSELPDQIENLQGLRKLDLCKSGIRYIPLTIDQLTGLRELDLSYTDLDDLPYEIGDITNLIKLVLIECNIQSLPSWIGECTALRELNLSRAKGLTNVPNFENLCDLKKLDLSCCQGIKSFPHSILHLTDLEELYLDATRVGSLPIRFGNLQKLVKLGLGSIGLGVTVPLSICECTALQELDLSRNGGLNNIPNDIGNLRKLRKLHLAHASGIISLPPSIVQLENLQELDLSYARDLLKLPDGTGSLRNLIKLDLSHSGIKSLPESIGQCTALEELNLCDTTKWITRTFPGSIKNLPQSLTKLNLSQIDTRTDSLPKSIWHRYSSPVSIFQLRNLRELDLSNTQQTGIPNEIGNLDNLVKLSLKGLRIERLPTSISKLRSLQELNLSKTHLIDLPDQIANLDNLKSLNLRDSRIESTDLIQKIQYTLARRRFRSRASRAPIGVGIEKTGWPYLLDKGRALHPFRPNGGSYSAGLEKHEAVYLILTDFLIGRL